MKSTHIFRYLMPFVVLWIMVSCGSTSPGQKQSSLVENPEILAVPDGWKSLLDKETLAGWEVVRYGGEGEPYVKNGVLVLPMAMNGLMTGVCWVGDSLPVNSYTIFMEARRMTGNDIFAGLSFPYGDTFATLIVGGWGGAVCGLSSIDGYDASENETTKHLRFKDEQWYPVQLRVTPDSICATIDTVQVVNLATAGKRIHLRSGMSVSGLTVSTYLTTGEIRNMRIKRL